jgi:hypothetical protein
VSYALVTSGTVQSEGGLPASARRLDTQEWVMGLATAPVNLQQATGWYLVKDVAKPADTQTNTTDRSVTLVAGVPTVTWTSRPKTQAEIDAATATTNNAAIVDNLNQDMAKMQTTIDTANATINANPAAFIKDIARMNRRLGRKALNDYTGST